MNKRFRHLRSKAARVIIKTTRRLKDTRKSAH